MNVEITDFVLGKLYKFKIFPKWKIWLPLFTKRQLIKVRHNYSDPIFRKMWEVV